MTSRLFVIAFAGLVAVAACTGSEIVVGDDTNPTPSPAPLVDPDADLVDAAGDAPPITVPPQDGGANEAGDAESDASCPTLSPPAPGFCDGASPVPRYDSNACIVGYGCAPLDCASAGGTCVGLAPGSCPGNHYGDATKYSCGGGVGVGCCLP